MKFPSHLNCDGKIVSEMGPWAGPLLWRTMTNFSHGFYGHCHMTLRSTSYGDCDNLQSRELFGRCRHNFAYHGKIMLCSFRHTGTQTICTLFGLICLFSFTSHFRTPCLVTYLCKCHSKCELFCTLSHWLQANLGCYPIFLQMLLVVSHWHGLW